MRVDLFDFELPAGQIAQEPVEPRDAARLLIVGEELREARVRELPELLSPGDLLVVNDTRVLPARFMARSRGRRHEVTLLRSVDAGGWRALVRGLKRLRPGDVLELAPDLVARFEGRLEEGQALLRFDLAGAPLLQRIRERGAMPLPPYIRRPAPTEIDRAAYQTIFAAREGAVAAPTAGLHFTERVLEGLARNSIEIARLTLHVGLGTFQPVRVNDTRDHRMHAEWFEIPAGTAAAVRRARQRRGRVVAVGTTVVRALETAMAEWGDIRAGSGETRLFITPGYRFRIVDRLLTNFHLPRSTLFMLVCAFAGHRRMKQAYRLAVERGYRFFSYGDACLLDRRDDAELPEEE